MVMENKEPPHSLQKALEKSPPSIHSGNWPGQAPQMPIEVILKSEMALTRDDEFIKGMSLHSLYMPHIRCSGHFPACVTRRG